MRILTPFNDNDYPCSIVHEYRITTKSRVIYICVILFVVAGFASLPLIDVPLIIESRGVIQARAAHANGKLKVYCYIKPSDIDKIRIGQPVSFQIDALNYRIWGRLTGRVTEISNELVLLDNDVAVLMIQCNIDKDHFESGGSRVYFKPGMSLMARFRVGDLSLFDLFRNTSNKPVGPNFQEQFKYRAWISG